MSTNREFSNRKNVAKFNELPIENIMGGKVPPNSVDAEVQVLGAMMLEKASISIVFGILHPDSFYSEAHRLIFEGIRKLYERNAPVDLLTLTEALRSSGNLEAVGGTYYLTEMTIKTPTAANVEFHARIVQEKYLKRLLIKTSGEILVSAYDDSTDALDTIDTAESKIFAIAEQRLTKSYQPIKKLARDTYQIIERLSNRDTGGLTGLQTGLLDLDKILGGFQESDLIILAGRPSMGKTAFALALARNTAMEFHNPIGFFSIEMSSVQLVMRLLSTESGIDQQKIRTGKISAEDNKKIVKALGKLSDSPIYIDDSPSLSILELRAKARRLKAEHNIKMIVVDYLQLVNPPKAESREREISLISQNLKQIAKELSIPVLALAQLNRQIDTRVNKRPMLSDLRESGSIEQDADVVMFINRPEVYKVEHYDDEAKTPTANTAEIIIGKQRNGPVGEVRLAFNKESGKFSNLTTFETPPEDYQYNDYPDGDDEAVF